ncbi:hypothetical protein P5V15_003343 [Pogonomyrmex californicus]
MKQLACILIALAIVGVYGEDPEKLVGGTSTKIEDHPHCVSIQIKGQHFCGGSLISKKHVLTAAHCVESLNSNPFLKLFLTVVTGTTYHNSGGEHHKVIKYKYHPKYTKDVTIKGGYDIGMLELAEEIQINKKQKPVKLPTKDLSKGDEVEIVAWGSEGYRKNVHKDLRKVGARVMLSDECQTYQGDITTVTSNEFCTLVKKGIGACNGDSGSGVIRISDGCIVGVVSRGIPCAEGYPDVFTTVPSYLPWIEENMA